MRRPPGTRVPLPPGGEARRSLLAATLSAPWIGAGARTPAAGGGSAPKVLRVAFAGSEAGFDPAQVSDVVSAALVSSIFDAPLAYEHLARPVRLKPNTAVALPEVDDGYRRFVFTLRRGILFGDHPAFGGRPRELVAADYVYSLKRYWDPALPSPSLFHFESAGVLGLAALRRRALEERTPFDYDAEVEGLKLLDRYTFQVRIKAPAPRFYYLFTDGAVMGAVAREVVEHYGDAIMAHPVGTGPFVLKSWRRSSKIVLERNPNYREERYAEAPPADDAEAVAMAQRLAGRRLPLLDRVEISIIEEQQPRWLAFLNNEHDLLDRLPNEFAPTAIPHNQLSPHLAKQGIRMVRTPLVDATLSYFAMENPVVGGYTPERVAFRRAMSLAYDVNAEIERVRLGQAVPAQSVIPPLLSGHDPAFRSEMSEHSPARANALLDLYGWVDRDGDGWRDQPDGSPLLLEYSSQPDQQSRKQQELWRKAAESVKVRIDFQIAKWPEQLKASRAGKLMMWGVAWGGVSPDGDYFLDLLYGPNKGQANHARFDLPAFDALYERQRALPDGPERDALMQRAMRLAVAYMPYVCTFHPTGLWLTQPQVHGFRPHPFARDFWRWVDVDRSDTLARAGGRERRWHSAWAAAASDPPTEGG